MRRTIRSVGIAFIALLGALTMAVASAFAAALAYGAVALIVPGTGTPNANLVDGYLAQSRDRYLTTTACGATGSGCPDANLQGINYPATFFPLAFIPGWCTPSRCNTWDDSVGQGSTALNTAIDAALNDKLNPGQQVVVFGYSQGGAVVADSLNGYINGLSDPDKARLQVVTIGGIENPDGGLWQRLAFLNYIPGLNISFNPAMNPNTGVNYTSYGFQYDPVVNAPKYFGNPFALVNALAAFENVHGYYLAPNGNGPTETLPFGYTDTTLASATNCTMSPANCKTDSYGNTYVTIPALTLPIYNLLLGLTPGTLLPLVKPTVNLLTPVTRLLIDLGYDTSGDPSVSSPLSILPFNPLTFNPVDFSVKFVAAIAQGIQDAINGGPSTTLAPVTTTSPNSTVAARTIAPQTDVAEAADSTEGLATVTDLSVKKNAAVSDPVDAKTPVTDDGVVAAESSAKSTPVVTESIPAAAVPSAADADVTTPPVKAPDPVTTAADDTKSETTSGSITKNETSTADATKDDVKKDDASKRDAKKDDSGKAVVKKDAAKKDAA